MPTTIAETVSYILASLAVLGTGIAWGARLEVLQGVNRSKIREIKGVQNGDHDLLIQLNTKLDNLQTTLGRYEDRQETDLLKIEGSLRRIHEKFDTKADKE